MISTGAAGRKLGARSLHGDVIDAVGTAVVSGEYAAGDLLDPNEVGARFGVSRSVVREAFRVLASLGLIAARHKVGTRVLPRTAWNLLDPAVILWRSRAADRDDQLRELLQLRAGFEPLAARLCAGRLTAAEFETLDAACDELAAAAATDDRDRFLRADETFHSVFLAACGNELIARLDDVVIAALEARQHESRPVVTEQTPASLALHRRIVSSLRSADRDVVAAGRRAERTARQLIELSVAELDLGARP